MKEKARGRQAIQVLSQGSPGKIRTQAVKMNRGNSLVGGGGQIEVGEEERKMSTATYFFSNFLESLAWKSSWCTWPLIAWPELTCRVL